MLFTLPTLREVLNQLNTKIAEFNEAHKASNVELLPPYDSFNAFLEDIEEEASDGVLKVILSKVGVKAAYFIIFYSNGSVSAKFSVLNASLSDDIANYSFFVKSDESGAKNGLEIETTESAMGSTNSLRPLKRQIKLLPEIKFTFDAITGAKGKELLNNTYFTKKDLSLDVCTYLTQKFNLKVDKNGILIPLYHNFELLNSGLQVSNRGQVYGISRIISFNGEKFIKEVDADNYLGQATKFIENSDVLIVGEGLLNVGLVDYSLSLNGTKADAIALSSATRFNLFAKAMPQVKASKYKTIIIVADNDGLLATNAGMEIARNTAKKMVAKGFRVAIFNNWIDRTPKLASTLKCDAYDAYKSLGQDLFTDLLNETVKNLAGSPQELSLILDQQPTLSKPKQKVLENFITKHSGASQNWYKVVREIVPALKVHSVKEALLLLCNYLCLDFSEMQETLKYCTLKKVQYKGKKPWIDTKHELRITANHQLCTHIKAPMGSGKTEFVIHRIANQLPKGQKLVVAAPTVALAKQLCSTSDSFVLYTDSSASRARIVITTIDSAHTFLDEDTHFIIDEAHLCASLIVDNDRVYHKEELVKGMRTVVEMGNTLVTCSADTNDNSSKFFNNLVHHDFDFVAYCNDSTTNNNRDIGCNYYHFYGDFLAKLEKVVASNEKCIIVSDNLTTLEDLHAFVMTSGRSSKLISSKTKDASLFNPKELEESNDIILVSPAGATGLSFTTTTRNVFLMSSNIVDTQQLLQLTSRARQRTEVNVYEARPVNIDLENKLLRQHLQADRTANSNRLSGVYLELLMLKNALHDIKKIDLVVGLKRLGYTISFFDSVASGAQSYSSYLDMLGMYKDIIEEQKGINQEKEVELYQEIVAEKTEQEMEDIVNDKSDTFHSDVVKTACRMELAGILSFGHAGLSMLNKKMLDISPLLALECDSSGELARARDCKNSTKISYIDNAEIRQLLLDCKAVGYEDEPLFKNLVAKYVDKFDSNEKVSKYAGMVLQHLGVKINFVYAAYKFNHANFKNYVTETILKQVLYRIGYKVRNGYIAPMYNAELRTTLVTYSYTKAMSNISLEDSLDLEAEDIYNELVSKYGNVVTGADIYEL